MKQTKNIEISVVIVNYKADRELMDCVSSILNSNPKRTYEIIVVDNDNKSNVEKELISKFPKIRYIKSKSNLGYGGGNNLGAHSARGKYLFFLNPDTKCMPEALDNLCAFLMKNDGAGMVSPVILDNNLKPFYDQGSKELTPKNIIFSQSFLRKIFPKKNIYRNSVLKEWDMKTPRVVDSVPGAAMMISAELFKKIGEFDEALFLYFEENDISKRLANIGYKLYIIPSAKIVHLVGRSTRDYENIESVYSKSRYLYLKKHYGLFKAILAQILLSFNKTSLFLLLILILAIFLRLFNLGSTMPFIGDQGWFYLSARDMAISGQIPLVGIASSHPWLHQGPLWTHMLAGTFWLFGFNPLNGAYLTVLLGSFSVLMTYFVGSVMFSKRIGMISALFYATSPLIITYSRTPYHTSPIPLVALLYIFSLYKFVKGKINYFPLSIFFLAILYNFELATSILWFILLAILLYGFRKGKVWFKKLFNKKILIYSVIAFLIPMLPILIYDFNNNFPQTLKFIIWIGYRILKFFGFPSIHGEDQIASLPSMSLFFFGFYQKLIFAASGLVSLVILVFSFGVLSLNIYRLVKKRIQNVGLALLSLWIVISFIGYFVNRTSSEAYLPILFPALIFLTAFSFDKIMKIKILFFTMIFIIMFYSLVNGFVFIFNDYTVGGLNYMRRLAVAREIVDAANHRPYNIVGKGAGSQFESFTMNYEYLTWWLGNAPVKSPQRLKYIILEDASGVSLIKNE